MSKTNKSNRKISGAWMVLSVGLLVMLWLPLSASADQCWGDYDIKSMENPTEFLESISEVIFAGKAVAKSTETFEHIGEPGLKKVIGEKTSFEIESVTKGDLELGENVVVEGKSSGCSCIGNFALGEKYLVHATVDDKTGKLVLRYCNFGKKIE